VSNGTSTATTGGPFTIVSGATFSVAGFDKTNVVVRFAPVATGAFTDDVVFATANGGTTSNVVSGTGVDGLAVALFGASPTNGAAPLAVTFTDNSTGTIASNFWDFGDGSTTNFTVPTDVMHTYSTPGTYSVTLIASGLSNVSTNSQANLITALDPYVAWQSQYFGCTACPQAAPDADPLGKGMSNTNQFLAGINPTDVHSAFRIISMLATGEDVTITWTTAGVRTNAMQAITVDGYSTNFQNIGQPIIIPISGDATTNYTDFGGATNLPARFYRVRLVP